MIFWIHKN